jgi:MoaA/NifB/PqqE/SkfB family radical SAM enzyme
MILADNKIIRIEPVPEFFSLTWMLGSFCNYDCMYCPSELHDHQSKNHDLADLKMAWQKIHKKTQHLSMPYKLSFTGGEVTASKSFLPFVKWLRNKKNKFNVKMISITTNGSASVRYYTDLANFVESISFSTHSEFINEKKFFETCVAINSKMIRPQKSFHVNIMDEPWNQDRIELYKKFLSNNDISYSVNEIDWRYKIRDYNISKGKYNIGQIFVQRS